MLSTYHGNIAVFVFLLALPLAFFLVATKTPQRASGFLAFLVTMWWPVSMWLKLPSFPYVHKDTWPYLCLLIAFLFLKPSKVFKDKPGAGPELMMFLSLLACLGTWKTNTDGLSYGSWIVTNLPGLNFNDGMSMGIDHVVRIGVPFFIGRMAFKTIEDVEALFKSIVIFALVYTIPIFIELKMSPRFHEYLYGYQASRSFLQMLRWGGYRPLVCMPHGLAMSLLFLQLTLVAFLLLRLNVKVVKRFSAKAVAYFLLFVLILCKSSGAIMYAIVAVPLFAKAKVKTQMRVAVVLSVLAISYPVMKGRGWIPVDGILSTIEMISKDRALSVKFRFENEKLLADRAQQRYWFGWGSYGRNSIYDDYIGKEQTIADGYWIILLGTRGFIGFVLSFGMGLLPVFLLSRRMKRIADERHRLILVALALLISISFFDLLPNGLFSNYAYFLSGILWSVTKGLTDKNTKNRARRGPPRDAAPIPR